MKISWQENDAGNSVLNKFRCEGIGDFGNPGQHLQGRNTTAWVVV